MILDSSAVLALLLMEPGSDKLLDKIAGADVLGMGAPTLAETGIVLASRAGAQARTLLPRFVQQARIEVVPFGDAHWPVALSAFERFGKGRHAAALNFGDCMSYAVAHVARRPLLCVGNDFARTDIELA